MHCVERKLQILSDMFSGEKAVIFDTDAEYKQLAEACGVELITLSPSDTAYLDVLDLEQSETVTYETLVEQFRQMLNNLGDSGKEFAKEILSDLSFLDDTDPKWKETLKQMLEEYVKQ